MEMLGSYLFTSIVIIIKSNGQANYSIILKNSYGTTQELHK